MKKSLVYLGIPYSDPDPTVMEERFRQANRAAAVLMREGVHVFSPISHTHPIALVGELPRGWDYWEGYDTAILQVCAALVVLKLPGWERSTGLTSERRIALGPDLDIPVVRVEPERCDAAFARHVLRLVRGGTISTGEYDYVAGF